MRQRARLQSFIDRFKAQASKARQAQSIRRWRGWRSSAAARRRVLLRVPRAAALNPLLTMDAVSAGYRNIDEDTQTVSEIIVSGINFSLQAGQRIGLLGINGAGKSTFIKTIAGELQSLAGDTQFNKGLSIGYFAQHQVEMLRHDESPLWHMTKLAPNVREQSCATSWAVSISTAPWPPARSRRSPAAKARLALALIVWQRPDLLLLDEPTNHLDLETREADQRAGAVRGTLVLVSHDRHLLRASTDQFIIVADGQVRPFDGDLDDYKAWLYQTKLSAKAA